MTAGETARFTWRDLLATGPYARDLPELVDLDVDSVAHLSVSLQRRVNGTPGTGGLLMWNRDRDAEEGTLVMFTGQSTAEERQVLENAQWLVSTGAVYSVARLGARKPTADTQVRLDSRMWVWLLPSDRDRPGVRR
jgi:hypothetical protein